MELSDRRKLKLQKILRTRLEREPTEDELVNAQNDQLLLIEMLFDEIDSN